MCLLRHAVSEPFRIICREAALSLETSISQDLLVISATTMAKLRRLMRWTSRTEWKLERTQTANQYGVRRARQAGEVTNKMKAYECNQYWSYCKTDAAKVFDLICHHCLADTLGEVCSNKKANFAIGKELVGGFLRLTFCGLKKNDSLKLPRVTQGAPESGPLLNLVVSHRPQPLQAKWAATLAEIPPMMIPPSLGMDCDVRRRKHIRFGGTSVQHLPGSKLTTQIFALL